MNVVQTSIPDVLIIEPKVFGDERGFFMESFNEKSWKELTGLETKFVQHNHSRSTQNVLRGLHYQIQNPQDKLVRVVAGEVYDVAVDIRKSSPTFGKSFGAVISADNKKQMWVPAGFAHGFLVMSESADFLYLTTDYWYPEYERCIRWNDPDLAVDWPILPEEPVLSDKDALAPFFRDADHYP